MKKSEVSEDENEEFDFEKDLSINKYKLDEECLSHSSLYFRYAEAAAQAKKNVSRAKNNLELVESERYEEIRIEKEKAGIKTTIPMLEKAVVCDEIVIKAKNKLIEAETIYSKFDSIVIKHTNDIDSLNITNATSTTSNAGNDKNSSVGTSPYNTYSSGKAFYEFLQKRNIHISVESNGVLDVISE